jgi:hypothetical protein
MLTTKLQSISTTTTTTAMARPSQIARKARRAHERQQEIIRAQKLSSTCFGFETTATRKHTNAHTSTGQQASTPQSLRSKIRRDLKNNLFTGIVHIVDPRDVALAVAAGEVGDCADRLVYWTNGSRFDICCGIGIAYCFSAEIWTQVCWRLRKCAPTHILEVYAIAKALEVAFDYCRDLEAGQMPSNVVIYSDNLGALELFAQFRLTLVKLRQIPDGERLVGPGILAAKSLKALGIKVELRYVLGHVGVKGNLMAHLAARRGAKQGIAKQEGSLLLIEGMGGEFRHHN